MFLNGLYFKLANIHTNFVLDLKNDSNIFLLDNLFVIVKSCK